ncbi:MAG TPA: hypothetical protein GX731_00860 [Clostridiales bacterium]|nr:hypothetical protein [Clostridiales bacterium]
MKERHYFAGNNTAQGFFSYFDYIINLEEGNHYYILKGGPGVGKSSFMKKFASKMVEKGYSIEYVHCSSDRESLDSIYIPELRIAFVDGTAPHTIDPKYPGAVDEIINLGYFFDSSKIVEHKAKILQTNKEKSAVYKSAYRLLKAAGIIYDEINSIYDGLTDNKMYDLLCDQVQDEFSTLYNNSSSKHRGWTLRKLFSEAYTADGYVNFTHRLSSDSRQWVILGENVNYSARLLDELTKQSIKKGYFVEGFYNPLFPEKLQHIYIPELKLMIKTSEHGSEPNHISRKECSQDESNKISLMSADKTIDLGRLMDKNILKSYEDELNKKYSLYNSIIALVFEKLSETKKLHARLEKIYSASMDFNGVDQYFETILNKYI